jgi:hypothetical protein
VRCVVGDVARDPLTALRERHRRFVQGHARCRARDEVQYRVPVHDDEEFPFHCGRPYLLCPAPNHSIAAPTFLSARREAYHFHCSPSVVARSPPDLSCAVQPLFFVVRTSKLHQSIAGSLMPSLDFGSLPTFSLAAVPVGSYPLVAIPTRCSPCPAIRSASPPSNVITFAAVRHPCSPVTSCRRASTAAATFQCSPPTCLAIPSRCSYSATLLPSPRLTHPMRRVQCSPCASITAMSIAAIPVRSCSHASQAFPVQPTRSNAFDRTRSLSNAADPLPSRLIRSNPIRCC